MDFPFSFCIRNIAASRSLNPNLSIPASERVQEEGWVTVTKRPYANSNRGDPISTTAVGSEAPVSSPSSASNIGTIANYTSARASASAAPPKENKPRVTHFFRSTDSVVSDVSTSTRVSTYLQSYFYIS